MTYCLYSLSWMLRNLSHYVGVYNCLVVCIGLGASERNAVPITRGAQTLIVTSLFVMLQNGMPGWCVFVTAWHMYTPLALNRGVCNWKSVLLFERGNGKGMMRVTLAGRTYVYLKTKVTHIFFVLSEFCMYCSISSVIGLWRFKSKNFEGSRFSCIVNYALLWL